ncbi:ABC transporter permease [Peribacillus frigoritolerans]
MIKKILTLYGSVFVILLLLNFFLPRLMPGGPVEYLSGLDSGPMLTEAQKASMIEYYNLNASFGEQFIDYLGGLLHLDFGYSFSYKEPVTDIVLNHLPYTLWIVGISTGLSLIIGILFGLWSGWFHFKRGDRRFMLTMMAVGALPEFLMGMILLVVFAVYLGMLPMSGASSPFLSSDSWWAVFGDYAQHAALPIITLTIVSISSTYLLVRNETIQVISSPFIEFAKMKGIKRNRLVYRHILKNALLPIFTLMMIRIGTLFTGAIFVETLFSYPGIGKLLKEAVLSRDYPLMHGLFFVFSAIILFFNALADFLYPKLDPRVKGGNKNE